MTTAKFSIEMGAGAIVMDVRGHANFAEIGKDPVCAGASILAMTIAQCADDMHEHKKLKKKPNITIRNGRVTVVVKPEPEYFHEALHLFWVAQTGMRILEEAYPGHVTTTTFGTVTGVEEGNAQVSDTVSID